VTSAVITREQTAFHLLAIGIRPLAADRRDVSITVTSMDPRLRTRLVGRPALEPHRWGGWSLRYQPSLRGQAELWCRPIQTALLPRRLTVRPRRHSVMVADLLDIEQDTNMASRKAKLDALNARRSVPLTMFLSPNAVPMEGASAFRGQGPAWARLIARPAQGSSPIGLGQCAANGSFVLPVNPDETHLPGTTLSVWIDVCSPISPPKDRGFPPSEPIDLRRVDDNKVAIPPPEERLRGTDPGPTFGPPVGAFHALVVASPNTTAVLQLT
jgi:hypothetical protein